MRKSEAPAGLIRGPGACSSPKQRKSETTAGLIRRPGRVLSTVRAKMRKSETTVGLIRQPGRVPRQKWGSPRRPGRVLSTVRAKTRKSEATAGPYTGAGACHIHLPEQNDEIWPAHRSGQALAPPSGTKSGSHRPPLTTSDHPSR
ncbi:t127 [Tupaiid betaherpesvirus 1]|uniref:T127 n=1 Tax=Tupaiid herpesvirus 1 (strain 1) TaxID=10397 RepID=Q91TG9_TUHV1|nr:t127 [Tupaiid betaherpesvirus 1]AAK57178.1 t127 [Tupaiid betaherpesvirus 1]